MGAEVTVTDRGTATESTLYTTETGGTVATQPLITDDQGRITAWAPRGRYQIEYTVDALPITIEYYDSVPGDDGAVDEDFLAANSVTETKIATNAVTSSELADDAVDSGAIQDNAVTNLKINDGAVTVNKIGPDAVDASKLRDDPSVDGNRAVTTNHIRDNAVTAAKIPDGSITSAELGTGAASSSLGKVNLFWTTTGVNATQYQLTTSYQTILSHTSVAIGVYLILPRFTVSFGNGAAGTFSSRIISSGSGFFGEVTTVDWVVEEGTSPFGGRNINMARVIWLTSSGTISIQAKVALNALDSIVADSSISDLVRIQ